MWGYTIIGCFRQFALLIKLPRKILVFSVQPEDIAILVILFAGDSSIGILPWEIAVLVMA